jgi:hypothetical protein
MTNVLNILSPMFTAKDGIDQGDSISPLMWRIFYDPLLVAIQNESRLGYETEILWPHNVREKRTWKP